MTRPLPIVHPFRYVRQPGLWSYRLTSELWIEFPNIHFGRADFYDVKGNHWCRASGHMWGIHPDYACDGCTGVPTPESTVAAAFWHDSTGQFFHTDCLRNKLTRRMWNRGFRDVIIAEGDPIRARVYHLGLTIFNPPFQLVGKLLGHKPSGTCLPR
jgi:hypothetical protein